MSGILTLSEVSYRYPQGENNALENISLTINAGERLALLGTNGAGKSTLFYHLNALLKPDKGIISYKGEPFHYSKKQLLTLRKTIGIVFQDPDTQLFAGTVEEDVSFGLYNIGTPEGDVRERVQKALKETGTLHLQTRPIQHLSEGEKKRVSIAGIIAMQPEVLIADEPTASLDPHHAEKVMLLLEKLQQNGTTVILSTHDVDLACKWADRVLLLHQGGVLAEGKPTEIFLQKEIIQKANLRIPQLLEIFLMLQEKGVIAEKTPPPRNIEELIHSVKEKEYD